MEDDNIISVFHEVENSTIADEPNIGDLEYMLLKELDQRLVTEMHKRGRIQIGRQENVLTGATKFRASAVVLSEDMYSHFKRCEEDLDNYVYGGYE